MRSRVWQWTKGLPNSTAFWLAVVGIALACSVVLPIVGWGWLRSGAGENGAESNSTTVRNIGFIAAGLLALVFAVWRGVLAQRQAKSAERQSETAQQGLLNERYQKGGEMLGSDILSVRLSGIYALQRLAEEYTDQYHVQIMELFCAFVRFPTNDTKLELHSEADEEQDDQRRILRPDVQDVMRAIGLRNSRLIRLERSRKFRPYLRDANVSYLQTADANLSRAWLTNANLSNSILIRANLSNARLRNANLCRANLYGANLSGALLMHANLSHASITDTNLSDATILGANLFDASLSDANLSNASFWKADLSHANLAGAYLNGADLRYADLTGASFSRNRGVCVGINPATGLTQTQLDEACSAPDDPPDLEGVLDAETGDQLFWRGRPLDNDSVGYYA